MKNKEQRIFKQLSDFARQYSVDKIILFGSRARGNNRPKSDIDIAVYGCKNFRDFYFDINEKVETLLTFDIINMDEKNISTDLLSEIRRDGVVIYEKIR